MSFTYVKPTRNAVHQSRARIFVGQLEPYVTEDDLYPVFSCYGRVLHLNVVRHSTRVTPNEERRIPTAFVWYESTFEADAAIAALHNKFSFSCDDEDGARRRYIQVSYADKSPECTAYGHWQKRQAESSRRMKGDAPASNGNGMMMTRHSNSNSNMLRVDSRTFDDAMHHHAALQPAEYNSMNVHNGMDHVTHLKRMAMGRQAYLDNDVARALAAADPAIDLVF